MDQKEWDACGDPEKMLELLRSTGKLSQRKARLFACACCRRIWHLLTDERLRRGVRFVEECGHAHELQPFAFECCRKAVEVAEGFADGLAAFENMNESSEAAHEAAFPSEFYSAVYEDWRGPYDLDLLATGEAALAASEAAGGHLSRLEIASRHAAVAVAYFRAPGHEEPTVPDEGECAAQAGLLRDIVVNPFHPPPPIASSLLTWEDGLVPRLADEAYEHRLLPSGHLDPERLAVLADAMEEAGADAEMVEHLRGPGPHVRGCHVVDYLTGRE